MSRSRKSAMGGRRIAAERGAFNQEGGYNRGVLPGRRNPFTKAKLEEQRSLAFMSARGALDRVMGGK